MRESLDEHLRQFSWMEIKAAVASNIALCYEIESKLTDAYEWLYRSGSAICRT